MTIRRPVREGICEAISARAVSAFANVRQASPCRKYGFSGNSRAFSMSASRISNIPSSYPCARKQSRSTAPPCSILFKLSVSNQGGERGDSPQVFFGERLTAQVTAEPLLAERHQRNNHERVKDIITE